MNKLNLEATLLTVCYPDDYTGICYSAYPYGCCVYGVPNNQYTNEELGERILGLTSPNELEGFTDMDIKQAISSANISKHIADDGFDKPNDCYAYIVIWVCNPNSGVGT